MLWFSAKVLYIPSNVFRGAVVVVQDGRYLVADDVDCLADADVQREQAVHDGKHKHVELVLEESSNAES